MSGRWVFITEDTRDAIDALPYSDLLYSLVEAYDANALAERDEKIRQHAETAQRLALDLTPPGWSNRMRCIAHVHVEAILGLLGGAAPTPVCVVCGGTDRGADGEHVCAASQPHPEEGDT